MHVKDCAYVINLDKYANTETHWAVIYVKINRMLNFSVFGVEIIPKDI